ncbi:MAG TPA: hypothetical protein VGB98_00100 [Pyrinomonadaceae bacterium]|jgi:hypothetical protein
MATSKASGKGGGRGGRRRNKPGQTLSEETVGTNLSLEDHGFFMSYVTAGEGKKADVLRALVHEAILAREMSKKGKHEADRRIRKIHVEAVETGTQGLAEKVDEALAILRKLGVGFEKLLAGSNVNFGLLFELLSLSEGVSSMITNDLTKPAMMKKANNKAGEVETTLAGLKELFEQRAAEKVEKVRSTVKPGATGLADAA